MTVTISESKRKGGKRLNPGKQFEKDFYASVSEKGYLFVYRLKDDNLGFANVKNPCDFILYKKPNIYLLELKSHKGKSIPFGAIQSYQIESLYRFSNIDGVKAGFVFNFRDMNETYFVEAVSVYHFYHERKRKSFSLNWVKENGNAISQELKRTRFKYDLGELLK
ncbi:Holliday junction resolvase RecU [Lysinibacillus sphaericus]|nr:Holliday junction resolvase RecU [Lysinibacillus sp. SDF0037]